jgi:hypothetical protein
LEPAGASPKFTPTTSPPIRLEYVTVNVRIADEPLNCRSPTTDPVAGVMKLGGVSWEPEKVPPIMMSALAVEERASAATNPRKKLVRFTAVTL